jgi:hypothetical protein
MLAHNQQGPHRPQSGQLPAVKALHTTPSCNGGDGRGGFDWGDSSGGGGAVSSIGAECIDDREQHDVW